MKKFFVTFGTLGLIVGALLSYLWEAPNLGHFFMFLLVIDAIEKK